MIIKELTEVFEGNIGCLGENTEKYITFSVLIKITKIDKDGNDKIIKISYKIKSLSTALDLCQTRYQDLLIIYLMDFMVTSVEIVDLFLDYMISKDEELIFRCFECKKNYEKEFNKELVKYLQVYMNFVMETLINLFCY